MIEQRNVYAAVCDGCGRIRLGHNDFEPVTGWVGTIMQVRDDGSTTAIAPWYACSQRCISKATATAVTRADQEGFDYRQPELPTGHADALTGIYPN